MEVVVNLEGCNVEHVINSKISRRFLIHIITATYHFEGHMRHKLILGKKRGEM